MSLDIRPTAGTSIKVWLPGESPWAVVIGWVDGDRILARIENDLVAIGHGYKYGDLATFEKETTADYSIWKLCPLERQAKIGPSSVVSSTEPR